MLLGTTDWPLKDNKLLFYSQIILPEVRKLKQYRGPRMHMSNIAFVEMYRAVCLYDALSQKYGKMQVKRPQDFHYTSGKVKLQGNYDNTRYFNKEQRDLAERLFKAVDHHRFFRPVDLSGKRLSEVLALSEKCQELMKVSQPDDEQIDVVPPLPRPSRLHWTFLSPPPVSPPAVSPHDIKSLVPSETDKSQQQPSESPYNFEIPPPPGADTPETQPPRFQTATDILSPAKIALLIAAS